MTTSTRRLNRVSCRYVSIRIRFRFQQLPQSVAGHKVGRATGHKFVKHLPSNCSVKLFANCTCQCVPPDSPRRRRSTANITLLQWGQVQSQLLWSNLSASQRHRGTCYTALQGGSLLEVEFNIGKGTEITNSCKQRRFKKIYQLYVNIELSMCLKKGKYFF